jgi:hypothetical protein
MKISIKAPPPPIATQLWIGDGERTSHVSVKIKHCGSFSFHPSLVWVAASAHPNQCTCTRCNIMKWGTWTTKHLCEQ